MQFLIKTIKVNQSFMLPLRTTSMQLANSLSCAAGPHILDVTLKTIEFNYLFCTVTDYTAMMERFYKIRCIKQRFP